MHTPGGQHRVDQFKEFFVGYRRSHALVSHSSLDSTDVEVNAGATEYRPTLELLQVIAEVRREIFGALRHARPSICSDGSVAPAQLSGRQLNGRRFKRAELSGCVGRDGVAPIGGLRQECKRLQVPGSGAPKDGSSRAPSDAHEWCPRSTLLETSSEAPR